MTSITKRHEEIRNEHNIYSDKVIELAEEKIKIQNDLTKCSVLIETVKTTLSGLNGYTPAMLKCREELQEEYNNLVEKCTKLTEQKIKIRDEMTEYSVRIEKLINELKSQCANIASVATVENLCDKEKIIKPREVGYMFLLIEREFIKTKESIYKIGRTEEISNIMYQHPKGTNVIITFIVDDIDEIEDEIIETFDDLFEYRSDIGDYYYEGNIEKMKRVFCDICLKNRITKIT